MGSWTAVLHQQAGRLVASAILAVAVTACAGARQPPPERPDAAGTPTPASANSSVGGEQQRTTPAGATFTVPTGWVVRSQDENYWLDKPGAVLTIGLYESRADTADSAVLEAMRELWPGFTRDVDIAATALPREGWALGRDYRFHASPSENRVVAALVLSQRPTGPFTVVALSADRAALGRRSADVERIYGSVRPPGYRSESFAGRLARKLDAVRVSELADFVERARVRARIPGAALSLVQDGKVIFEGGFGQRELGKENAVGPDTRFLIGSTSKTLTTTLLAKLVDEGRFGWQTPAATVYRAFRLASPELTQRVQMRHLTCHCTGLPTQNAEWWFEFDRASPRSIVEFLSDIQPTTPFGETYQYSNNLAAAAGYLAGHALYPQRELGEAYDLAMQTRVLSPLAMDRTTFDFELALSGDHASPHEPDVHGRLSVATMAVNYSAVPMRPAAGAWSTARDLARYLQFELASGLLPNGQRHVSTAALAPRYEAYVKVRPNVAAGLGVNRSTRSGVSVIHTGGVMPGFTSYLMWLPEHGVGAALLSNATAGIRLESGLRRKLLELLFDGQPEAETIVAAEIDGFHEWVQSSLSDWSAEPNPSVIAALAPHYQSRALGDLRVRAFGAHTYFDFGGWRAPVASRRNPDGSTTLAVIAPGIPGFEFNVAEREGKRALVVIDHQHEYVFVEAPERTEN